MDTFGVEAMKKTRKVKKLKLKVLRLYDEFALFSDQCAFLCDAFAAVPAHAETITPATLGGLDLLPMAQNSASRDQNRTKANT